MTTVSPLTREEFDGWIAAGHFDGVEAQYVRRIGETLASDPEPTDGRVPGLIAVNGSIGSTLIVGTDYRVAEIREHHDPSSIEGGDSTITSVIRFEPIASDRAALAQPSNPSGRWTDEHSDPEGADRAIDAAMGLSG